MNVPELNTSVHAARVNARKGWMLAVGLGVGSLLLYGCGGKGQSGDTQSSAELSEEASYYRDKAKQLFGSDLVRVEPISKSTPQPSYDDFVKMRRELDLRQLASAPAPSAPGPPAWQPAAGNDTSWLESDRPEAADRKIASGRTPRHESRTLASPSKEETGPVHSPWDRDPNFERQKPHAEESKAAPSPKLASDKPDSSKVSPATRPAPAGGGERREVVKVDGGEKRAASAPDSQGWSIVLALFRGENHAEEARATASRIQSEGHLPQAFVQRRGLATAVVYGRYTGPEDPAAQADLKRIQEMVVNGVLVYGLTYLCPPPDAVPNVRNEYDLRNVKKSYGKDALYTLQVGFYGREELAKLGPAELAEIRSAAEQAVLALRKEGELAFFYHGPNRSSVLIGVFDATDFDSQKPGIESERLKEVRKRHPANLYNGQGYTGKVPGMKEPKLVPSALVAIPNK